MDEQYWDALTNRIQSAESFLKKSCYSHSPDLIKGDMKMSSSPVGNTEVDSSITHSPVRSISSTHGYRNHTATFEQLNTTVEDGRLGFKKLIEMNNVVVLMGPVLIGLSAISGIALQNTSITLIFGVLGISVVIAMFLYKPGEKIQAALANLIQAETVSADFYNQVQIWAPYAHESEMEDRQQASQALHDATTFALKALHDYVKPKADK